jgi:hypothetical protein
MALAEPAAAQTAEPAFDRQGVLVSLGVGVTHCAQNWCSDSVIAGMARAEVGYRYKWISPVVYVGGGGAPLDPPDGVPDGTLSILGTGVGVRFFPNLRGRVDPYLGLGLGYSRIAKKYRDDFVEHDIIKRGAAVFTGGLSIYVHRRLALGPRFDYTLPFAGKLCSKDQFGDGCTKVKEIFEDSSDPVERANRRQWPRPWSLTLDLIAVF